MLGVQTSDDYLDFGMQRFNISQHSLLPVCAQLQLSALASCKLLITRRLNAEVVHHFEQIPQETLGFCDLGVLANELQYSARFSKLLVTVNLCCVGQHPQLVGQCGLSVCQGFAQNIIDTWQRDGQRE